MARESHVAPLKMRGVCRRTAPSTRPRIAIAAAACLALTCSAAHAYDLLRLTAAAAEARESGDSSSRVVGTLVQGDEVQVHERKGVWLRVVATKLSSPGWIPAWVVGPSSRPSGERVVASADVNVRTEPRESAPLVAVLSQGFGVTVLESDPTWARVRIEGTQLTGWVPAWAVRPGTPVRNPEGAPEVSQAPDYGKTRYVTAEGLYLRSAPTIESDPVCILGRDAVVYPVAVAGEWVQVNVHNGPTGWVCRVYLGEAPGSVVSSGVRTIGAQPQARGELVERREELREDEGMIYQDHVNVRAGASDNFPVVATMPAGAVFRILGQSGGWYHAQFRDGSEGWVASWLCLSNKMPEDAPQEVIVQEPTPPPQAAPVGTGAGNAIAWYASRQIGKPYIWGAEDPSVGFDCSGLVYWCHKQIGVHIPRVTYDQVETGYAVPVSMLLPGDELFFNMSSRGPEHCGVYMGNGWFIHAPGRGKVVKWQRLSDRRDFCGARRLYLGR